MNIILATDMARHNDYMQSLKTYTNASTTNSERLVGANNIDKSFVMEILIKCADTSNVLKPFDVAKKWAVRVTDEFFLQGDIERAHGLDVTPMCDRYNQGRVDSQKGFVDFVIGPFYEQVCVFVCVICLFVCVCVYVYLFFVYVYLSCVCVCERERDCMCLWIRVCLYICSYIHACMSALVCMHLFFTHIYMHTDVYMHLHSQVALLMPELGHLFAQIKINRDTWNQYDDIRLMDEVGSTYLPHLPGIGMYMCTYCLRVNILYVYICVYMYICKYMYIFTIHI
jgi:hypothetical protein